MSFLTIFWLLLLLLLIIILAFKIHKGKIPKKDIKEDIEPESIPIKIYCSECSTEILDKSKMFCPMCGKEQNKILSYF